MNTPYMIKLKEVEPSNKLIAEKVRETRKELTGLLEGASRDFATIELLTERYIRLLKTNDVLLGYAIIEAEKE